MRPPATVRYDNTDRVVLVTGGSGGIGMAICEKFLQSGAKAVGCVDVNPPEQTLDRLHFFETDVSKPEVCEDTIRRVVDQFGAIDVLVNNAAIQPPASYGPLHEVDAKLIDLMVKINYNGYAWMARPVLRQMVAQGSGVVVNMASAQAHRSAPDVPAYSPLKAGNKMQAVQWALQYARHGIRVVSVSPGAIDTPLVQASLELQGGAAKLANRHPLGRLGKPEEIAAAVLWLTSDDASFVTACDLSVDGGLDGFGAFADPYPLPESTGGDA